MTRALFVHQNYPGQFKYLAPALVGKGWDVRALKQSQHGKMALPIKLDGVEVYGWQPHRGTTLTAHPWVQDMETKLIRAEATAEACEQLKRQGWKPDLLIGHPGWGEMLFIRHIWPEVPQVHLLEFYYAATGLDVGFDDEFSTPGWREQARITAKSAPGLLGLEQMSAGIAPTEFQANTYPSWTQDKISVIHDGVDTDIVKPNANVMVRVRVNSGEIVLRHGDPVITFVNRNLEPYRGYHRFMRALPEIQRRCPNALTIIVGGDGVSYGAAPPPGTGSWKQIFLDEVSTNLDLERVIFTGSLEYQDYLSVLQISACHIYFTYPFVLGWSCIEAMAAGALVVGSATEPVSEVIKDGENGILVDFFDQDALVDAVCDALSHPERYAEIRRRAREMARLRYDLHSICIPRQICLLEEALSSQLCTSYDFADR